MHSTCCSQSGLVAGNLRQFSGQPLSPPKPLWQGKYFRDSRPHVTRALFGKKAPAPAAKTIVPEPSYSLPLALAGISAVSAASGSTIPSAIAAILGAFLAFQASRVKFRFEPDALEVVLGEKENKSENKFVGGENRWKYSTFTNWEFWWPNFPVLVYFKENQTKPEGQIHFFPVIFNGKQVYDVMVERCGSSQNSGPQ